MPSPVTHALHPSVTESATHTLISTAVRGVPWCNGSRCRSDRCHGPTVYVWAAQVACLWDYQPSQVDRSFRSPLLRLHLESAWASISTRFASPWPSALRRTCCSNQLSSFAFSFVLQRPRGLPPRPRPGVGAPLRSA
jgi:hypothetical protein